MTADRIGILGGTFDPIHIAHVALARAAHAQLSLEHVLIIPNNVPPHRSARPRASFAHRLRMAQLATERFAELVVSDTEGRREGPSYMVETLMSVALEHPDRELVLILGDDALAEFDEWRDPEGVRERASIARVPRPDHPLQPSVAAREPATYAIDFPSHPISARELRADLGAGRATTDRLDPRVAEYIAAHELYR